MHVSETHYDVIIIGTGAGGGTIAHRLASAGQRILILERGSFLPREKQNWDAGEVYQRKRYHTEERWYDRQDQPFRPATGYWVGGNTKVYGAALIRLWERDWFFRQWKMHSTESHEALCKLVPRTHYSLPRSRKSISLQSHSETHLHIR